ncbi:spermidine/putrescine ABC transporter ATP-binding protein [Thioclava sediminum]|uniref:Spermidine/putrescine ABC transporter ATP-binding protein n=2 Tax=Thioclava TaxID=285107 RepID=A0ABX3MUH0_9RHOB|nr:MULTISPECIES: ABC transporter ATP-binding protein [Thioclava]OOY20118.1 spermidine/putrescine ABC transporter ATP-binding protein [Thioclava sp. DLFJ5-1]OOY23026.1 spermidine/putrescine ABC transporter ATP-binding protein [Thioclava sediminum]
MASLEIEHLEKSFGANRVVKDFNLSIEEGEFISLLGPSGCGKTTVLRMVAGFESPSGGAIRIGGQDVTHLGANQRNIGMVFQAYALFPNLTVAQNVGFGLRVAKRPRAEIKARVTEMLELIGLPDLGNRYPFQLSGGQQQRVALARALAIQPRVLLLDEPLSALDAKIRVSLREEIRDIQRRLGITTIFVTHDQEEALSISDRVVVMNGGVAEQIGAPFEIYNQPKTRFVAQFVGTLNALEAEVADPERGALRVGSTEVILSEPVTAGQGTPVTLAARPEVLALGRREGNDTVFTGRIVETHFLGSILRVRMEVEGQLIALDTFNRPGNPPPKVGTEAEVSVASRDLLVLAD